MQAILAILQTIGGFLGKILPYVVAFFAGKSAQEKKQMEAENEILKKQRDNDIVDVTDAIELHKRKRGK